MIPLALLVSSLGFAGTVELPVTSRFVDPRYDRFEPTLCRVTIKEDAHGYEILARAFAADGSSRGVGNVLVPARPLRSGFVEAGPTRVLTYDGRALRQIGREPERGFTGLVEFTLGPDLEDVTRFEVHSVSDGKTFLHIICGGEAPTS